MGMSPAYISAVTENLPEARIVFDHFHVIKMFNDKLIAYHLKEDLGQLWLQNDKTEAETFLDDWISQAENSEVPMLIKFAKNFSERRKGLLAYYEYHISNGPLEGTNNKIKTMKRQTYGFRGREFFNSKLSVFMKQSTL